MVIFDLVEKFRNFKSTKSFVIFPILFFLQIYLIDWLIIDSYAFAFWI